MTRYELLKKNEKIIYQFIKNGILSYMLLRDIEIFESLNELEDTIGKEMKYILLAEQYELSTDRIKQIIHQMLKEIN
ncbi:hypothetical protein ACNQGL_07745 [Flavobacterium sp. LB3P21]|uniref:hypothetical protein n=1 Tax=Flavobacterium sp. LB3P21 TaxID=3401719 RepID=UPI003AAED5EA